MLINYDRIVRNKYIKQYEDFNTMENQTVLEKLDAKISQMIQKCEDLKNENEIIRSELVTLKAQQEIKDAEIEKLMEENTMKDLEIEEIVNKIESILG